MKLRRLLLLLVSFFSWPAYADDCWAISKLIGLCDAGDSVERSSEKLRDGMVESATIVQSTVNPFVQLIYWLHAGTEEEKKQARQILEGAFGMKLSPGEVPSFRATVSFRNMATTGKALNVALLRTSKRLSDEDLEKLVEAGEFQDLNFAQVIGASPGIPESFVTYQNDIDSLRKAVDAKLTRPSQCGEGSPPFGSLCLSPPPTKDDITNAIMAVVDRKVHLSGARPAASFNWTGERHLIVLIPESDLRDHPNLQVFITLHPAEKIDQPLPDFVNNEKELVIYQSPVVKSGKLIPAGTYRISRYELKG